MAVGDINVDNERRQAEIEKLQWETQLIEAQTKKTRAETEQKLQIEIGKMVAETSKVNAETRWYGLIALSTLGAAIVAALTVIAVKLIHS